MTIKICPKNTNLIFFSNPLSIKNIWLRKNHYGYKFCLEEKVFYILNCFIIFSYIIEVVVLFELLQT